MFIHFSFIAGLPLLLQVIVVLACLSFVAAVLAFLGILLCRYRGFLDEKKKATLLPLIDHLLTEHIILNEGSWPIEAFKRAPLQKKASRQILINRIIDFKKSFTGSSGDLLIRLYKELELEKLSTRKLGSFQWNRRVKGLYELTNMSATISKARLLRMTNVKNRELRTEARHAYIRLSKSDPFSFFDILTEPLLLWDQIELFKAISSHEEIVAPPFSKWIDYSTNDSLISFCLRLVVHFDQRDAVPAVIRLLDHKDPFIRADAIECLGKLHIEETEDRLVAMFSAQPLHIQLKIITALGRMDTGKQVSFLQKEFVQSPHFDIRMNAARSLAGLKSLPENGLGILMDAATPDHQRMLRFWKNPLMNR